MVDTSIVNLLAASPIRSMESLRQHCGNAPITVLDREPFPKTLRLVVSSHCNQHCQYPSSGTLWCHAEGLRRDGLRPAQVDRLLATARQFYDQQEIRRVKIGGLEPVLGQQLLSLISLLREMGMEDISFTTHGLGVTGRLAELYDSGLNRITISIHSFDRRIYEQTTGRDGLQSSLELVEEAQHTGLRPIKINRVLLRGYIDDVPEVIGYIRRHDITLRLFELMWQPGHDEHFRKFYVPWQELMPHWMQLVESVTVHSYRVSGRWRVLFALHGGGCVEANLHVSKASARAKPCQSCELAAVCAEGFLGCGPRVTPDLQISPCILRPELAVSVNDTHSVEEIVNGNSCLVVLNP